MPRRAPTINSLQAPAQRWRNGTKQQRGYGGEWEKISLMKRRQTPVCEVCRAAPATEVDHIIPFKGLADPLRTAWDNLQSICSACHSAKTKGGN